jgi:hypothetical protein
MYCPMCGTQSTQGLNYCKRCGSVLSASSTAGEPSLGKAMGTILFLSLVSIAGFIALFTTVYSLGQRDTFDTRALVAIMAFGGATVVGVVGLFVWLLLRLTGSHHPEDDLRKRTDKAAIRDSRAALLQPDPSAVPSVTENTTRNFEPAHREKGFGE